MLIDNCSPHSAYLADDKGKNRTNGRDSIFSGHKPNRACLGESREMCCGPLDIPIYSPRTKNSSSGGVAQNTPTPH